MFLRNNISSWLRKYTLSLISLYMKLNQAYACIFQIFNVHDYVYIHPTITEVYNPNWIHSSSWIPWLRVTVVAIYDRSSGVRDASDDMINLVVVIRARLDSHTMNYRIGGGLVRLFGSLILRGDGNRVVIKASYISAAKRKRKKERMRDCTRAEPSSDTISTVNPIKGGLLASRGRSSGSRRKPILLTAEVIVFGSWESACYFSNPPAVSGYLRYESPESCLFSTLRTLTYDLLRARWEIMIEPIGSPATLPI